MWAKTTPSVLEIVGLSPPLDVQHQNTKIPTMGMWKRPKTWRIKTQEGSAAWELNVNEGWMIRKCPAAPQNAREDEKCPCMRECAYVLGVFFPMKSKHVFKKWVLCPIQIFTILFPSPCNNYLNQILAEINDRGKRQEMGSW